MKATRSVKPDYSSPLTGNRPISNFSGALDVHRNGVNDNDSTYPNDTPGNPLINGKEPIIVLAGTSDPNTGIDTAASARIRTTLQPFHGILISGGTRTGVGALAGDIAADPENNMTVIGYLPKAVAPTEQDPRYHHLVGTEGSTFSILEPVTYWRDIVAAGIDPASITVFLIGGGRIAEAEARLALALDAQVIGFPGFERAADRLLADPVWSQCPNLRPAPESVDALRVLLLPRQK